MPIPRVLEAGEFRFRRTGRYVPIAFGGRRESMLTLLVHPIPVAVHRRALAPLLGGTDWAALPLQATADVSHISRP